MSFLVIDNYDSFTYNLVHYLGELGAELEVVRNDAITLDQVFASNPQGIILSPGPCTPNEAGICVDLIKKAEGRFPILGVCLGHQAIGQAYGAAIVRATQLMHGKTSKITHNGTSIFKGMQNDCFRVTRYHSLTIDPQTLPDVLKVTSTSADGTIMGVMHQAYPVHGVQFHPESIASEHGHEILKNFLDIANKPNYVR